MASVLDVEPGATSSRRLVSFFLSIIILGGGALGFYVFGRPPEVPRKSDGSDGASEGTPVRTVEVRSWDLPFHLDLNGEAVTWRVITVGAEVAGRVTHRNPSARGGQYVEQGDVLFEVDSLNYRLEAERLKAELAKSTIEIESIQIDISNSESLLKLAEEESRLQKVQLQRMIALHRENAVGDTELDNAIRQELTSRNSLLTIQNQLASLKQQKLVKESGRKLIELQLERAEADLKRCRIVSPIAGRVVEDEVEEGDYVRAGDPLIRVSDSSRMEVRCALKGEEAAWVWQQYHHSEASGGVDPLKMPQVPCEVVFEFDGVETVWDGYLSRFEGTGLDRQTRMFPCRTIVHKPGELRVTSSPGGRAAFSAPTLLSGMFVKVRIPIRSPVPLLQVPVESVRPGGRIWLAKSGQLTIAEVTVARVDDESALIRRDGDSLQAGDRGVVSPLAAATAGMPVREINP